MTSRELHWAPAAWDDDGGPRLAVVVTDREWSGRALESALADGGFATLRAQNATQAIALCAAANPDVVFVEQRLATDAGPGRAELGGVALCRRLRHEGAISDATALVLTTADTMARADVLSALRAGAWEVYTLPADVRPLVARCDHWSRAKRRAARATELGLVDPATGFYNLRGLARRAGELLASARRDLTLGSPGAVACAAFRVNADEGRGMRGDVPLDIAEACRITARASDIYARVGARDYAIVARGATADGMARILERLEVVAAFPLRSAVQVINVQDASAADLVTTVLHMADVISSTPKHGPPLSRG